MWESTAIQKPDGKQVGEVSQLSQNKNAVLLSFFFALTDLTNAGEAGEHAHTHEHRHTHAHLRRVYLLFTFPLWRDITQHLEKLSANGS